MDSKELSMRLYSTDIVLDTLDLASCYLSQAKEAALRIGCFRWVSWIQAEAEKG